MMLKKDYIHLRMTFKRDLQSFLYTYMRFFYPNTPYAYFYKGLMTLIAYGISEELMVQYLDEKNNVLVLNLNNTPILIY